MADFTAIDPLPFTKQARGVSGPGATAALAGGGIGTLNRSALSARAADPEGDTWKIPVDGRGGTIAINHVYIIDSLALRGRLMAGL